MRSKSFLDSFGLELCELVSGGFVEGSADFLNVEIDWVVLGSLKVRVLGSVKKVVVVFGLADLTVIGVGGGPVERVWMFGGFFLSMELEISFNFFFELKSLEGLVLGVVLLEDRERSTWSVGRKKAGVKKSLSWLNVGMIDFAIPCGLCPSKYTLPSLRSLSLFPLPAPLLPLPAAQTCSQS